MKLPSIGITAEGLPIIALTALTSLIFAILSCWFLSIIFLILVWFSCHFFRDPERVVPQGQGLVVSPADGKIISITKINDPITGEKRLCICVFMNVFSVHVNRVPVSGTITNIVYHSGKFFNAAWDKAATDNERCIYQLVDKNGQSFTFVQIAGLIARRIVCRVDNNDVLQRGQRFGLIRFGSRVDLYLPEGYAERVRIGEQVFAGQSIVAQKVD